MRGAVIAGGAARRFAGNPKGLERVGGERVLDRVAAVLSEVTGQPPIVIANAPDAATWRPDLRTIPDARPGCGSLGGLYTAVTAGPEGGGGGEPVLCVAWDMPFVPAGLLAALVEGSKAYDAFLPESDGRRGVEPLCAVYGPACAGAIAASLDAGDFRAIGFHQRVRVGRLPLERVREFGDPERLFFNINTADDLARAEALWRQHA